MKGSASHQADHRGDQVSFHLKRGFVGSKGYLAAALTPSPLSSALSSSHVLSPCPEFQVICSRARSLAAVVWTHNFPQVSRWGTHLQLRSTDFEHSLKSPSKMLILSSQWGREKSTTLSQAERCGVVLGGLGGAMADFANTPALCHKVGVVYTGRLWLYFLRSSCPLPGYIAS